MSNITQYWLSKRWFNGASEAMVFDSFVDLAMGFDEFVRGWAPYDQRQGHNVQIIIQEPDGVFTVDDGSILEHIAAYLYDETPTDDWPEWAQATDVFDKACEAEGPFVDWQQQEREHYQAAVL